MLKELWNNLHVNDQNTLFAIGLCAFGVMFIITWICILVAIFSGPSVEYKCSDEQSVFVEKSIKACLEEGSTTMGVCTSRSKETYCSPVNNEKAE